MDRRVLEIGQATYKLNAEALCDLLVPGRGVAAVPESWCEEGGADFPDDLELGRIFGEVMQLYREYTRSGSLDVLVGLKHKLEEVSVRYRSVALAEEVLCINSCLPYERRVKLI